MSLTGTDPERMDYVPYFEDLIVIQERAIVSFKWCSACFVSIGVIIITLALIFSARIPQGVPQIVSVGGGFIGVLAAALPYREIAPRRSRIRSYMLLRQGFAKFPDL